MEYNELLSAALAQDMRLPKNIADTLFWEVDGKYITFRELSEGHAQIDFDKMSYEKAREVTLKIYTESRYFRGKNIAYRPDDVLREIENGTDIGKNHVNSRLNMARLYYDLVKMGRFDW